MSIEVRPITAENESALALPNDPFPNGGRVVPLYDGTRFTYRIEECPEDELIVEGFPDENYSLEKLGPDYYGYAAYVDGVCAGFALYRKEWNKWLYLDNLLITAKYRRKGVATALLEEGMKLAAQLGRVGIWTICQDNNLDAFRFYIADGFSLEGMDLSVYEGTKQQGKADLFLFRRLKQ